MVTEDGRTIGAGAVVLATGGAAALWSRTTNPPGSQGTGMLLAHLAGAQLADLRADAVPPDGCDGNRGARGLPDHGGGARRGRDAHDPDGERFVDELAPRDEVSRAIAERLAASGAPAVELDMTMVDAARFPNVVEALLASGLDPTRERIRSRRRRIT